MIELQQVFKTFQLKDQSISAVKNVSLTIKAGEIFGIIGYSGAGKSTLIRLINLLERPDRGTIIVDNQDLTALSSAELRLKRQKIGMIFQHFNLLWSATVYDNVALPLKIAQVPEAEIKPRVLELLKLVDLLDKKSAYPSQLSGGQKQRVGIARALANKPKVLLCDEATSALDPETTRSILQLLKTINQQLQVTIVLISHEMVAIKTICDKVAVMDQGEIVELGTTTDLLLQPQSEVTKSFLQEFPDLTDYQALISRLKESAGTGYLLELSFPVEQSDQPLLAKIIQEHQLNINILHGQLYRAKQGTIGQLYISVDSTYPLTKLIAIFAQASIIAKEVN